MITPQEAARIAEEHPNEDVQQYIRATEREIERQARDGRRETIMRYAAWCEEEVADFFRREGWDVRREVKYCGGVRQPPAYYIHW